MQDICNKFIEAKSSISRLNILRLLIRYDLGKTRWKGAPFKIRLTIYQLWLNRLTLFPHGQTQFLSPCIFCFYFQSHALTRICFPGMYWVLPWECSSLEGIIIHLWCRWSDCIGYRIEIVWLYTINHLITLQIHNETQWPTAAQWWHFTLRDISCRLSWHLSSPSNHQAPK